MNVERIESVLHELTTNRESRKSFREDAAAYFNARGISESERDAICSGDVSSLFRAGVSPLLIMGLWVDTLRRPLNGYVRALDQGASKTEARHG
ncbi:hypothetical protein GCM10011487_66510 [Steroidobacter agaridevorans]|uniref:Extradiol ring-cleavage dioxygenase LigAB LigA subunit domain-containing protein n=1 Tax=Steroidobacter agaridevorans TaxID=2695856 RepID=A0A829YNW1_9GAMM|nr:hypothetical protein [Steroidobacter agaridevorans]GFE84651.1 hypothetical protein GCM10011487_66510 [Steroidobacter agaridevorans]